MAISNDLLSSTLFSIRDSEVDEPLQESRISRWCPQSRWRRDRERWYQNPASSINRKSTPPSH
jgi:hypothetical protein